MENGLAPSILSVDYDKEVASGAPAKLSPFVDGVVKNVSKLHQVLATLLPDELLEDVFGRIFNYLGFKMIELFETANNSSKWSLPGTQPGKERLQAEIKEMVGVLGALAGIGGGAAGKLDGIEQKTRGMLGLQ